MTTHKRPDRVGQLIQQRLAELFVRGGLKDPRLGMLTVTGSKVSPDLRQVRVYWTVHGDEAQRKATQKGLEAARGFLRRELSSLGLRVVPELSFSYDEAIDRGDRIDQLLRQAKAADQRRMADAEVGDGEPAADAGDAGPAGRAAGGAVGGGTAGGGGA